MGKILHTYLRNQIKGIIKIKKFCLSEKPEVTKLTYLRVLGTP